MIQDIFPRKYNNAYKDIDVKPDNTVIVFQDKKVLAKIVDNTMIYPRYEEIQKDCLEVRYLFAIDEELYFLGNCQEEMTLPEGYAWEDIALFREPVYGYQAFAGITAYQLYGWYRDHRICSKCGKPLEHSHTERMLSCSDCNRMIYPQICPAVIVAITDGDKLLLTKYAAGNYKRYALVAGFNEIGESIEETVHREVMEEVGLRVKNLRFYKSQPWSFTNTLLFGFFVELDGSNEIKMDQEELSVAEWVDRSDVPHGDTEISLTREMMNVFYEGGFDTKER